MGAVRLENDTMFVRAAADRLPAHAGLSAAGPVGTGDVTGPVLTRPKSPTSSTESVTPSYTRTREFALTRSNDRIVQYRLYRRYLLIGVPIDIDWTVSLVGGYPLAFATIRIRNAGSRPLLLDQDDGDTHDGIQVLKKLRLGGDAVSDEVPQFALSGDRPRRFAAQPLWKTYPAVRYVTLFTDVHAVTYGYVRGGTGPKMAVVGPNRLDLMVNETRLGPGESVRYDVMVAVHDGGSGASARGAELFSTARRWDWDELGH